MIIWVFEAAAASVAPASRPHLVLTRVHLVFCDGVQVYLTLAGGVLVAALGSVVHLYLHLGGLLSTLVCLGSLVWLASESSKPSTPEEDQKRLGIFALFTFAQGLTLGGLVEMFFILNRPELLTTTLLATVAVFASFSLAAMSAKQRSMLFLGGVLGSGVSILMVMSLVNMFVRSSFLFSVELYLGLAIFVLYVCFDTQLIIAMATAGSNDFVWHAAMLFVDFVGIFVRIAIILLRNADGKKKSNRR